MPDSGHAISSLCHKLILPRSVICGILTLCFCSWSLSALTMSFPLWLQEVGGREAGTVCCTGSPGTILEKLGRLHARQKGQWKALAQVYFVMLIGQFPDSLEVKSFASWGFLTLFFSHFYMIWFIKHHSAWQMTFYLRVPLCPVSLFMSCNISTNDVFHSSAQSNRNSVGHWYFFLFLNL